MPAQSCVQIVFDPNSTVIMASLIATIILVSVLIIGTLAASRKKR